MGGGGGMAGLLKIKHNLLAIIMDLILILAVEIEELLYIDKGNPNWCFSLVVSISRPNIYASKYERKRVLNFITWYKTNEFVVEFQMVYIII